MAYQLITDAPTLSGPSFLGNGQAKIPLKGPAKPQPCPPLRFVCDVDCPVPASVCLLRKSTLCERTLGAIKLANRAALLLEEALRLPPSLNALRISTLALFLKAFGQGASETWEIPGLPGHRMKAGEMAAQRFRTVAKELQTRDTLYRCVSADGCLSKKINPCSITDRPVRNPNVLGFIDPKAQRGDPLEPLPKVPCHPTDIAVIDTTAVALLCKNEVLLCPPFWQLNNPLWEQGTILHEMFHLCFGLTCAWFQHDQKERRQNSANCYEVFAVSLEGPAEPAIIDACAKTPI